MNREVCAYGCRSPKINAVSEVDQRNGRRLRTRPVAEGDERLPSSRSNEIGFVIEAAGWSLLCGVADIFDGDTLCATRLMICARAEDGLVCFDFARMLS